MELQPAGQSNRACVGNQSIGDTLTPHLPGTRGRGEPYAQRASRELLHAACKLMSSNHWPSSLRPRGPTVSSPPVAARMAASRRMLVVSSAFKLLGARPRPTFPFASLVVSTALLPPSPRPCHRFGLIPILLQPSLSLSVCLSSSSRRRLPPLVASPRRFTCYSQPAILLRPLLFVPRSR